MLTERLTASNRCPSAKPVGTAYARGRKLDFTKQSKDLSGKATLAEAENSHQYGVLFEIDKSELPCLDREEGYGNGYERDDTFMVVRPDGERVASVTYIASSPKAGLIPYDWYLALIVAGANQHGLPAEQIKSLQSTAFECVDKNARAITGRRNAMDALAEAGFDSIAGILNQDRL